MHMHINKFSFSHRIKSFGYAFNGIKILLKEEHNSRIHISIALMVLIAGIVLKISVTEWLVIVFAIGLVITLETINSSVENLADFLTTEENDKIKKIKDLSAASVLISSITAIIIGLIVFLPKIASICLKY